jgi:hypothetical protein
VLSPTPTRRAAAASGMPARRPIARRMITPRIHLDGRPPRFSGFRRGIHRPPFEDFN